MKKFIATLTLTIFVAIIMATPTYGDDIRVVVDGVPIQFADQGPVNIDGRILVPVRCVLWQMGFDPSWDSETNQATLTSRDTVIVITIGSNVFTTNGVSHTLDVPAQNIAGRTLIPLRHVLESVGHRLYWDGETSTVSIEPPDAPPRTPQVTPESLHMAEVIRWIEATSAVLNYHNFGRYHLMSLPWHELPDAEVADLVHDSRAILHGWGITDRASLRRQLDALVNYGHNDDFLFFSEVVTYLGSEDAAEFFTMFGYEDVIPRIDRIIYLNDKWGDTGVVAWDLFRAGMLINWAYTTNFIGRLDAIEMMEPVIARLQHYFSSWEAAIENYMDGFSYWGNIDPHAPNTDYTRRWEIFDMLLEIEGLFDNAMFN